MEIYLEAVAQKGTSLKVRTKPNHVDLSESNQWLSENRPHYLGKWVVLDGRRLVGAGSDPRPIVAAARAEGVKAPFVKFVEDDLGPFTGGWL